MTQARGRILVRNPSNDPSIDGMRPAYPDRSRLRSWGLSLTSTTSWSRGDAKLLDGPVICSESISSPDKFPVLQDYPDAYTFGPPFVRFGDPVSRVLQLLADRREQSGAEQLGIPGRHDGPERQRQAGCACGAAPSGTIAQPAGRTSTST